MFLSTSSAGWLEGHTFLSSKLFFRLLPKRPKQKQKQNGIMRYPQIIERLAVRWGSTQEWLKSRFRHDGLFRGVTHRESGAAC